MIQIIWHWSRANYPFMNLYILKILIRHFPKGEVCFIIHTIKITQQHINKQMRKMCSKFAKHLSTKIDEVEEKGDRLCIV